MSHIERFEPKCNGRPLRVNIVSRGPEEDLLVFLSPPAVSHPTLDTRSQSTSKSDYYHSGRRIRNPPASDLETFSFVRPSNPRASILQSSIRLFPSTFLALPPQFHTILPPCSALSRRPALPGRSTPRAHLRHSPPGWNLHLFSCAMQFPCSFRHKHTTSVPPGSQAPRRADALSHIPYQHYLRSIQLLA
ncbi:hypothetical protein D9757_014768 [Collybiopsis confluens]|uniref:Uncharacterized protein n=1 Tax=Collybiopsis confluens TaxID=2823264 RepID=A0A8H5D7Z0_9AGAR|nr:hypothetical protein D9757_014768 [Collybiopsis confluens]